jgi:hypothetical protein
MRSKVAAGNFSELQTVDERWISLPTTYKPSQDLFCKKSYWVNP